MSVTFFEGPAGSGKTHKLMESVESYLAENQLKDFQKVLALTKMHGSRRRMQQRLSEVQNLNNKFECLTADSFAIRVLKRWRSFVRVHFGDEPAENDFDEICRRAGVLLNEPMISSWVAKSYPLVVVDELQDSGVEQLRMIKGISQFSTCLTAADYFQDLSGADTNPAVDWAKQKANTKIELKGNQRTSASGLLHAAKAIRVKKYKVPRKGDKFIILPAFNPNMAAKFVSQNLTWWRKFNDIVIISPTRIGNSDFIRKTLKRVESKPIGKEDYGPHNIPLEQTQRADVNTYLASMKLPEDDSAFINTDKIKMPDHQGVAKALQGWFSKQRSIVGRSEFTVGEIKKQVELIYSRTRAYKRTKDQGVRAMTIHQAKNREFNSVIVLWPFQVPSDNEIQRRMLYNAITRAQRQVVVIVQEDPTKKERLNKPPFNT